jgi:hypothetical protein
MRRTLIHGVVAAVVLAAVPLLLPVPAAGQNPAAPHTVWGDPDLEGIWSYATITPLERPERYANREFLTREEIATSNSEAANRGDQRSSNKAADVEGAYNSFWWDRGQSTGRTSLIIDPPDGRLPPMTAEGERRRAAAAVYRRDHGFDSWESRPLQERCLTYHGVPPLPTGYNNHFQVVQAPGMVALLSENIHDVRLIPLDGRARPPARVGQWNGISRGRWEGETLVVETGNYHEKTALRFQIAPETTKAVERFRRAAADRIDYRFTITDPTTYTKPFTVDLPLNRIEGPVLEYACHEGNYGLRHVLEGARFLEHEEADHAAKGVPQ